MAKGFNSRRGGMGGMGGMGGVNSNLLRQAQKMQQDMIKAQEELEAKAYDCSAGGGAVIAVVNGKHELTSISIDPDAVDPEDVETLEDMVMAAVNGAMQKASEDAAASMSRLTGGMNLPF